jgi:hypothetical protein
MLIAASAMALLAAAPAVASARVIGSEKASGDYAVAVASGNASHPHSLWVKVTATPRQRVSVSWFVVCSKGFGSGSKSGDFKARTTATHKLRMPTRSPDDCTVSASAQLDRGGRLRVTLLAY